MYFNFRPSKIYNLSILCSIIILPIYNYVHVIYTLCMYVYMTRISPFSQSLMKKVTDEFPDDVEAWIELAAILEYSDISVSE